MYVNIAFLSNSIYLDRVKTFCTHKRMGLAKIYISKIVCCIWMVLSFGTPEPRACFKIM